MRDVNGTVIIAHATDDLPAIVFTPAKKKQVLGTVTRLCTIMLAPVRYALISHQLEWLIVDS